MVMAFLLGNSSFPLLVFQGFFRGDRHKTRLEGKERRKGTFKREKGAPCLISLLLFRAVTGGREEGEASSAYAATLGWMGGLLFSWHVLNLPCDFPTFFSPFLPRWNTLGFFIPPPFGGGEGNRKAEPAILFFLFSRQVNETACGRN